jgi:hypothetical protein
MRVGCDICNQASFGISIYMHIKVDPRPVFPRFQIVFPKAVKMWFLSPVSYIYISVNFRGINNLEEPFELFNVFVP